MDIWWNNLILPLQIFYGIGIISAILLVIEALLTLFGLNHHGATDVSFEHPDQLGMLSVRTITGFFFGFGWTGVIAIKSGFQLIAAIGLATLVGGVFLIAIFLLMRALFSLRASGTLDYKNAVGQIGTVYVTVPPDRGGGGQVEVLIQGRLQMISCMTANTSPLPPQSKVRITGLIDRGTLEVEPL